jgi:hypothetical protein
MARSSARARASGRSFPPRARQGLGSPVRDECAMHRGARLAAWSAGLKGRLDSGGGTAPLSPIS